ncbi:hypothetical protein MRX96_003368 [Rhipicephalus microplus]
MNHARSLQGELNLRMYWTTYKIFHYGIFNLEVKPWETVSIDVRVKQVFEFFKVIRDLQNTFKLQHPGATSPARGYIVLGVRFWPANIARFFTVIDNAFHRWFLPDGFIPLTHINEDEFLGGYKKCWISGGAPYRLAPNSNNSNVVGMVNTIEAVNFTKWNGFPSLAVSVSMCTRVYKAEMTVAMDAPLRAQQYCMSLEPYENPTVDATQNVVVGTSKGIRAKDALSTFESRLTINSKLCDINKMFRHLDLGLALFDLECEDWELKCPAPTAGIYSTYRFRNVSQQTHMLARIGVANACP